MSAIITKTINILHNNYVLVELYTVEIIKYFKLLQTLYDENEDGERLNNWATLNRYTLNMLSKKKRLISVYGVHKPHQLLWFVLKDRNDYPLRVIHTILSKFPRSLHRPIIIEVGICLPRRDKPPMPIWNFQKPNWGDYNRYMEDNIKCIEPIPENFKRFQQQNQKKICHIFDLFVEKHF